MARMTDEELKRLKGAVFAGTVAASVFYDAWEEARRARESEARLAEALNLLLRDTVSYPQETRERAYAALKAMEEGT